MSYRPSDLCSRVDKPNYYYNCMCAIICFSSRIAQPTMGTRETAFSVPSHNRTVGCPLYVALSARSALCTVRRYLRTQRPLYVAPRTQRPLFVALFRQDRGRQGSVSWCKDDSSLQYSPRYTWSLTPNLPPPHTRSHLAGKCRVRESVTETPPCRHLVEGGGGGRGVGGRKEKEKMRGRERRWDGKFN